MNGAELNRDDLIDIQGLVLSGYGHLICSRFVFLRVAEPHRARQWLANLLPQITTSAWRPPDAPKPRTACNIAFTYVGLGALGLSGPALDMFGREFREGMASGERPRVLGDTDDSAPASWDIGGSASKDAPIHILLLCYALNDDVLSELYTPLEERFEANGLAVVYEQDTGRISDREPFGFMDGISQPFIAGSPGACPAGETPLNAGEFLLGYRNGYDTVTPSPFVPVEEDGGDILPPVPDTGAAQKDFGLNGTFLVFRKLAQDVTGFWKYVDAQAALLSRPDDKAASEWVAAKIVGRWPSGAPLVLAPHADKQDLKDCNDFGFTSADPDALACPVGAHIRRANPRDSLVSSPEHSRLLSNRHRLIRRGRHYEDHRKPGDTWEASGIEHGLCFIALNADIQRQFEFIQQTWLFSPKFGGLHDEKDMLTGDNDGEGRMTLPARPVRQRLCNAPRFARVRGGGYFFLPGLRALRFLAKS